MPGEPFSLYIHWPFCPYRCHYCPFVALAGQNEHMLDYHRGLLAELKQWAAKNTNRSIKTIYFGGGTPSTYPDDLLLDTSGTIKDVFDTHGLEEVTLEVNPGTVKQSQVAVWLKAGINRLSIGVQSLQDAQLQVLNRGHTCKDAIDLVAYASRFFDNISIDVMLGLPGMMGEQWRSDLQKIVHWPVTHISLYCLQLHELTPLYFKVKRGELVLPDEDLIAECYKWAVEFLSQHGFLQYEVSNFSRKFFESKHNTIYWERKPYRGIGLAACSFENNERTQNESSLTNYLKMVHEGVEPVVFRETLSYETIRVEKIMLGLRRTCGIARSVVFEGLSEKRMNDLATKIDDFIRQGFMVESDNKLMLTSVGFVVENEIISEII